MTVPPSMRSPEDSARAQRGPEFRSFLLAQHGAAELDGCDGSWHSMAMGLQGALALFVIAVEVRRWMRDGQ